MKFIITNIRTYFFSSFHMIKTSMAKAFLKERVYGAKYSPEKNQVLGPVVRTTSSRAGWGRDHVHRPELMGFFNTLNRRKFSHWLRMNGVGE